MYLKRALEPIVKKLLTQFPIILVTGPRQVGKTTMLKKVLTDEYQYVTLDDYIERKQLEEPYLFFKNYDEKVILDEIQYVPSSFSYLKMLVDQSQKMGQFVLTGSQSFDMMKNVSESLAGRIAIFELQGLSLREQFNVELNVPFLPSSEYITLRQEKFKPYHNIWKIIHRGYMPRVALSEEVDWEIYYSSYVQTYIERDVRQIVNVENERLFMQFMISIALRSGELLNYQSVAKDIGVSIDTIKRWLSVLEASKIIYLLYPYSNNHLKRAIKTPKLYFLDTGLLSFLTKWPTAETLEAGSVAGNVFKSFVISEIIKSYYNAGKVRPPLYYDRDRDQKEIDLIIEDQNILYPIEISHTSNPTASMVKSFDVLKRIPNMDIAPGVIICRNLQKRWLSEDVLALPIEYI